MQIKYDNPKIIDSEYFKLLVDVKHLKRNEIVNIKLYEDHLAISSTMSKKDVTLKYSKITDIYYGSETETVTKNKSVIKRAIVGGLLLGEIGALLGAIDGTTTKQKKINRYVLIISYRSSSGTDYFLKFEDNSLYKGPQIANTLKSLCNIQF